MAIPILLAVDGVLALLEAAARIQAIAAKAQAEGRTELTDEEVEEVRANRITAVDNFVDKFG